MVDEKLFDGVPTTLLMRDTLAL